MAESLLKIFMIEAKCFIVFALCVFGLILSINSYVGGTGMS